MITSPPPVDSSQSDAAKQRKKSLAVKDFFMIISHTIYTHVYTVYVCILFIVQTHSFKFQLHLCINNYCIFPTTIRTVCNPHYSIVCHFYTETCVLTAPEY